MGLGPPLIGRAEWNQPESTKQMEEKLNFQVPAGLELVILLHTRRGAPLLCCDV